MPVSNEGLTLSRVGIATHADSPEAQAWQAADDFAQHVYRLTWKFVQSDPGLAQRMRGAAISIAAQIAEACRWNIPGRRRRVLQQALAAAAELSYYLHFARRAGLLGEHDVRRTGILSRDLERRLDSLLMVSSNDAGNGNVSAPAE